MIDPGTLETLSQTVANLATQDNRATADPLYCVQKAIHVAVEESDTAQWYHDGDYVGDEVSLLIDAAYINDAASVEHDGCTYPVDECVGTPYEIDWETVQGFLTEDAAAKYLDANKHNLSAVSEPRIYVDSLYRNREMIAIRNALPELLAAYLRQKDS